MKQILSLSPVLPVVTLSRVDQAMPLGTCLLEAGIPVLEIALRSEVALPAIELLSQKLPELMVGAGTLRHAHDFASINNAGARFAVSPGMTSALLAEAARWDIPFLPAASTPGEMMALCEQGYSIQKFFPAEAMGGTDLLKAVKGPFPDIEFCPSGGIDGHNFREYLELDSVLAVSGSWIAPSEYIANGDWQKITQLLKDSGGRD